MDSGKIKDIVKEQLGLNDTSLDAKLYLNGKEYSIDNFTTEFQQAFDFKGEPQREVKGGLLSITLNQVPDEQLNYWMFHDKVSYSGSIVFSSFSRIATPILIVNFTNGRCARYSTFIGSGGGISLHLVITAETTELNGIEHANKR
jgi:hypothetical protein